MAVHRRQSPIAVMDRSVGASACHRRTHPSRREEYAGTACRLPGLACVGWTHLTRATAAGMQAHRHPGCWELCWLAEGDLDWWFGSEPVRLNAKQCCISRPGELHGSRQSLLEGCTLGWLAVRITQHDPWLAELLPDLRRLPRCFPGDSALTGDWRLLLDEIRQDAPHAVFGIRTAMERLLLRMVR
jgi:mannose-6-phosphate isomerase-like protein (cupin superfamily)